MARIVLTSVQAVERSDNTGVCADVSRLEQMKLFAKVIAPFDATITQRFTDTGDLINAGNGGTGHELFRMARINVIRVYVTVLKAYSAQVTNRMKATLQVTCSLNPVLFLTPRKRNRSSCNATKWAWSDTWRLTLHNRAS